MPYITIKVSPKTYQLRLEDIIMGEVDVDKFLKQPTRAEKTMTRTYFRDEQHIPVKIMNAVDFYNILDKFENFVKSHKDLYDVQDRHNLYHTFKIPKKSGGLRTINAPNDDLMNALRELKDIFENDCHAMYHTAAFAYVSGRSTIDCVKKHQMNESRWFLKTDFSNFFGSTTKEFIISQLEQIFPFNFLLRFPKGTYISQAIDLCMLDGGLPQGTPISPMLTNLMMVPVDAQLNKALTKEFFVYTRYADDIQISCKHDFNWRKMVERIDSVLESFHAPFKIKPTKTHYGSSSGQNWNLGVMLNKDNNITIGWKNTQRFNAMCNSFILDRKNNIPWVYEDITHFRGLISYYKMIEPEKIDSIIQHYNTKYGVDMLKMIKEALM